MPRILVADDNSNIHRTVALALKDAGVEVVAVGNGEAAVRKIAEIKPDLVLADIFMPVRNGYEVCEFVKQDARFAGVPVVLLIGVFDPFDEREAQRVQADAILKKPFVPADSLVRTVADLLAKSARLSPAPVATAATPAAPPPAVPSPAPSQEFMDEPPEAFEPPKARLEWDSNEQPVAFGTLLETAASETGTDETVVTSQRDPNLGEPAFWAPQAQPEQGESDSDNSEPESSSGFGDEEQWRSGGALEELPVQAETVSAAAQPQTVSEAPESELELPELVSPVDQVVETQPEIPVEPLQAATEELPQLPVLELPQVENLAALPTLEALAEAPVLKTEAPQPSSDTPREALPELKDFAWAAPNYSAEQTQTVGEPDAEIDPAPELKNDSAEPPALATLAPFLAGLTSSASARNAKGAQDAPEFDAVPAFPGDFASESAETELAEPLDAPADSQLDPAVIEAIAQRVIERMQPKIIELVTRELLRPAVEALVQRELEKK